MKNVGNAWGLVSLLIFTALFCHAAPLEAPDNDLFTAETARKMITVSQGLLAPVYAPLAEQIVDDYDLDVMDEGIGVDLGGGHGALLLELCARTRLHWVNADINPHFFPWFFAEAEKRGVGHQVSAIFADGQLLPFRDNYADSIVSRGAYHFMEDRQRVFSEIYRVLKPGGTAYIGRGFARNMPVAVAKAIREKQGDSMIYDREESARELRGIMEALGIKAYKIEIPSPEEDPSLNYGIWIEIRKEME